MAQIAVISILFLSITFPGIPVTPTLSTKVEPVLLPIIVGMYGWFLLAGLTKRVRINGLFVVGLIYSFCVSLSMWYGSTILGHALVLSDFFELPKLWLPVAYFTLTYEAELSEASLRRLLNFMAVAVVFVCLYGWAQFLDLGFSYKLNAYYTGGIHHDVALEHGHRAYSTMGNPNILGQLLSWMLATYVLAFLFKIGSRLRNLVVAFLCLAGVVMTGSRYALIMSLLGLALILVVATGAIRRRAAQFALLVFVLVPLGAWTFVTIELKQRSTTERFDALKHPLEVDSLRERLDKVWLEAEFYYRLSPWVGHGPAKAIFMDVWDDSEYLGTLKRYGSVGFIPYLAYYVFPLFLIWRGIRAARQRAGPLLEDRIPATFMIMRAGFAMVVMAMVMNIGMSTFYCEPLQGFLWLWLGLAARSAKTIADASASPYTMPQSSGSLAYVRRQTPRQTFSPRWGRITP